MNLRQKAKKYKQRCEQLEHMVAPTSKYSLPVSTHRIVTLGAEEYIHDGTPIEFVNRRLAVKLSAEILNYARVMREPFRDGELLSVMIDIVDMR